MSIFSARPDVRLRVKESDVDWPEEGHAKVVVTRAEGFAIRACQDEGFGPVKVLAQDASGATIFVGAVRGLERREDDKWDLVVEEAGVGEGFE